jgi:MFS family permease
MRDAKPNSSPADNTNEPSAPSGNAKLVKPQGLQPATAPKPNPAKLNQPNANRRSATPKPGQLTSAMNLPTSGQSESSTPTSPLNERSELNERVAVNMDSDDATLPAQGFLPVLKNRQFLTLWSGQVFSQIADKVYLVLMIALIDSRFQADDQPISGWVSSIMIAFTIPAILFGSVAGVYVDRWSKKGVLVLTNLLRGALVLAILPLLGLVHNWQPWGETPVGFALMLVVTFLVSTLTQFFAPAEQSVIPLMVAKRDLLSANSLYTTTMMISVIVGFALGEPLLALAEHLFTGLGVTDLGKVILVGGGYGIAGLLLIRLQTGEQKSATDLEPPHVWDDIKDGLRYLGEQAKVRAALIQLVILFSIFAALSVLVVRLAEVMPELKSSQFGFLLAAGGVGLAIGAAILGSVGQRVTNTKLGLYGSIGMASSLVGLAFLYHHLWGSLVMLALVGSFAALVGIPMQTTIQQETPEAMRGKVFGLQNNAVNIALSLPLVLAGIAESALGLKVVFLGLAGLVIAGGALSWYISRNTSSTTTEP